MKKYLYILINTLLLLNLNALAKFNNTCKDDMATHMYIDINQNSIKFSPSPQDQVVHLSNGHSYTFTEKCTDYKDPNTTPTIVITAQGLGTINGTFIPLTATSPLLHVTGALNADLQQASIYNTHKIFR